MQQKIKNIMKFLHDIERLKSTIRHCWTTTGRQESVAEHSFRMSIMAIVLQEEFPKINITKVIEMCLIHDIGEAYDGDIPACLKKAKHKKLEEKAVQKIVKPLSNELQDKIYNLWKEFEQCKTQEAKLAQAIDKLECLIQHNEANISTWTPQEYKANLVYGQKYNQYNDFIKAFRAIIDTTTKQKIS